MKKVAVWIGIRRIRASILLSVLLVLISAGAKAQAGNPAQVFYKLRDRVSAVKDYIADVRMKIDVGFMRVPLLTGKLYYKAPGKLKLERNGGISVLPKRSMSLSVDQMMPTGAVTVIDAGRETVDGVATRIIKVIPEGESDIVLAKLWVDESRLLTLRTETTTREQGTIGMRLYYKSFIAQTLPDRIVCTVDVKEYKLPKGVTMDYDEGAPKPAPGKPLPKKGTIEVRYLSYKINTGLSDAVFVEGGKK